ncbi:SRPBCC family protein [Acaryochloris sp. IP29b_bin.148]|uniref:SRPBCC family protein n=1 Tax=Acaryochloris sp. IP29b_bin.148 TaxID=2969218 RepID=UPI002631BC92|nr:SRPBCC family protein [Acaryochloris sp. IP29b_bin.148]
MADTTTFEQSVYIEAPIAMVDRTITDQTLMHLWLNPLLKCEPVGEWSSQVGSQTQFMIRIPFLNPTLYSRVIERQEGLVVWAFEGFFQGCDRWQCQPEISGTRLINRFEFRIENPLVALGFQAFAAKLTRRDMQSQLQRLKQVAETQHAQSQAM